MIQNKHKVPQVLWKKLTEVAKQTFNDVMEQALMNQSVTTHPDTAPIPQEEWQTICYNMAYYAAFSLSDMKIKKGTEVTTLDKNNKEVETRKFA